MSARETAESARTPTHAGLARAGRAAANARDRAETVLVLLGAGVLFVAVWPLVAMVAAGRHMTVDQVRVLADGRAYSGRQALQLGLIDEIGGETDARNWLAAQKGIAADLPVRDISTGSWAERTFGDSTEGLFGGLLKTVLTQGLTLDGAWAVWQPSRGDN